MELIRLRFYFQDRFCDSFLNYIEEFSWKEILKICTQQSRGEWPQIKLWVWPSAYAKQDYVYNNATDF